MKALWLLAALAADPETLLMEAIRLHQQGQASAAIPKYEAYLAERPRNPIALSNLGAALAGQGRYEEAASRYRSALAIAENPGVRLNLGLALYKQVLLDDAIEQFLRVREAQPENRQVALLLADSWLATGEHGKVIALLEPWERHNANDPAVNYLLGTALIRDNQVARGEVIVDRILRNGESPEALLLLASVQLAGTANKDALRSIEKAIDLNPALPGVYTVYGFARLNDGNPDGAKEAFLRELDAHPDDFEANLQVGALFRVERDFARARAYFDKARLLRPRSVALKFQFGALALAENRLDEALEQLESVAREAPDFVEGHVSLATLYYRLKRKEDGDRERAIVQRLNEQIQQKELKKN
jgi:tetratricopeptide (TPR) repeat protein